MLFHQFLFHLSKEQNYLLALLINNLAALNYDKSKLRRNIYYFNKIINYSF